MEKIVGKKPIHVGTSCRTISQKVKTRKQKKKNQIESLNTNLNWTFQYKPDAEDPFQIEGPIENPTSHTRRHVFHTEMKENERYERKYKKW